jgi:hypothetical protein
MTGTSTGPSSEPGYGPLVHKVRRDFNDRQDKPFGLGAWEDRHPKQRELDNLIGETVAEAATADLRSRLADADNAIGEVIQHVWSWAMSGKALDPADVERVLVSYGALRPWAGLPERGEAEPLSPLAAELDGPEMPGQLPFDSISDEKEGTEQ